MAEARRMRPLLGTFVEAGARAPSIAECDAALAAAYAEIEALQQRLSFQSADSELTRLNRSAGERVPMHRTSLRVLTLARALMRGTSQLFDITVGEALVRRGALPDHGGPAALERGDASDIELGPGWARLRRPLRLTLDGIAKGYAVDLAIDAMRSRGATAGWINAGGDLRAFGDVHVPVQRREADRRLLPLGDLHDAALASSHSRGEDDDIDADFPALIIGGTGASPARGVFSVLARRAWRADALTKVACLAPTQSRGALISRLGGALVAPREAAA